ncbi:MAG: SAM-dependent methyltransferase [Lysobacter sp.]|nr:SAM-dependent methyltransferase [Lysobacter sp.]
MRVLRLSCAIALVSAGALGYQLLLVRWLAIAHWHPLAVVIISLALLGHGASGSALSVAGQRAVARFDTLFPAAAIAFAACAILVLPVAAAIPFNGLELAWNPRQLGWFALLYLVLSLPFFFAACCFGLAFARFGSEIPRLYGADLLGAGAGAVVALVLLRWLPVERAVVTVATLGLAAAIVVLPRRRAVWLGVPLAALAFVASLHPPTPPVNEFKALAKALLIRDARVVASRQGAYGWLAVLDSPRVPLRHAPGLSLSNLQEPPRQLGVFLDGDAAGVMVDRRDPEALAYLQRSTSALPYVVEARGRVAVLGAGAGVDVAQALEAGATHVDAVERDMRIVDLVRHTYAPFAAQLYDDPRVRIHRADARAFLRADRERHDLIVFAQGASFAAGNAGVQAVAEDYGATVEALRDARDRLAEGGVVAITGWDKAPPRDALKVFATAVEAWRDADADPAASIAMLRNWDAWTLVAKRGAFTPNDIARIRAFADAQGFDLVHVPGIRANDANRIHVLPRDDAFLGAQALLSTRNATFLRDYKFDIAPARDDRPYFANFFRWSTLPELWRLRAQGAAVLLDSGYLLLVAALVQAIPLGAALVLLPLLALPRASGVSRWRAGVYFVALGLGFLFIEIACLSRLALLVGHPLLAFGAGLAGFLAFAGLGSTWAQAWIARSRDPMPRMARLAVLAIAFGVMWHLFAFPLALSIGAAWPPWLRAGLALLTIAPVAFAMGLPFPLGLARLAREAPAFVPWAWGLNGCASVVAAIAALLVALHVGLVATLAIALVVYAIGAWTWRQ